MFVFGLPPLPPHREVSWSGVLRGRRHLLISGAGKNEGDFAAWSLAGGMNG